MITGWASLGFYRGTRDYQYSVCKYEYRHLYTSQFLYGIAGSICYLNPGLAIFIFLPKELYRVEINIRGLENEMYSDKYNEIM